MSYESGAPKYKWVGAKGHSLLAGFAISSGGTNYLVVHSDQVSQWTLAVPALLLTAMVAVLNLWLR